jgi:hypothetical protein
MRALKTGLVLALFLIASSNLVVLANCLTNTGYETIDGTVDQFPVNDFYNRKAFYASNRYWVFFVDAVNAFKYATSTSGLAGTWTFGSTIEQLSSADIDVKYDPGGNYFYYHYQRGTPVLSGYTRKGTPNADGSISWAAAAFVPPNPWYVVLDQEEACTGLNKYDTVWYGRKVYIDSSPDYWDYLVTLNNVSTGTQDPSPPIAGRLRYHGTGVSFPTGHYTLCAVNGSGYQEAFVFYSETTGYNITYRRFVSGAWGAETDLDTVGHLTDRTLQAVADGTNVYFLFADALSMPFLYQWDGSSWSGGEQPIGSVAVTDLALTVDLGTHKVYMVYSSDNMQTVKVVSRLKADIDGTWTTIVNWNPTEHPGYEMAAWSEISTPDYVGVYASGINITRNISVYFGWFGGPYSYSLDFINMQVYAMVQTTPAYRGPNQMIGDSIPILLVLGLIGGGIIVIRRRQD